MTLTPPPPLSPKFDSSLSLLSWAYNEESLIEAFVERAILMLDQICDDYEVVLVDDGSTDRTPEILEMLAQKHSCVRTIHHEVNKNVGHATRTAVASATKEYLFWQTVDWSYDLSNIRIFLELLKHYDIVQGIRPVPLRTLSYIPVVRSIYRVEARSDNFRKAVISLTNYYVLRVLFGVPFQDFQNVTFYPTKLAQSLSLQATTPFINPELLIKSFASGARFLEVPIPFISRTAGVAKGTRLRTIIRTVLDIIRNWMMWGLCWRVQGKLKTSGENRIDRVSTPFSLPTDVLYLCVPLFAAFKANNSKDEVRAR